VFLKRRKYDFGKKGNALNDVEGGMEKTLFDKIGKSKQRDT